MRYQLRHNVHKSGFIMPDSSCTLIWHNKAKFEGPIFNLKKINMEKHCEEIRLWTSNFENSTVLDGKDQLWAFIEINYIK